MHTENIPLTTNKDSTSQNTSQWTSRSLAPTDIRSMFDALSARYNILNDLLSLGIHRIWKNLLVSRIEKNAKHLDLCCGTGDIVARAVAKKHSKSTGLDFSPEMILKAKQTHPDLDFIEGDATQLAFGDNSFDFVTISFGIRNIPKIDLCFSEVIRVLKPNGKFLVLEFGTPKGIFGSVYALYGKYILPVIGACISGHRFAYDYLQETQSKFPCGKDFEALLMSGNFRNSKVKALTAGLVYLYEGQK